ncbi:MAG: tRNA epoxyqueuosine(34) reductase QueG [Proteobacteria bacterium]|nr:tRNA epoxyqueuosine(34) reductase QueG [Pseudomonadota bacterium]
MTDQYDKAEMVALKTELVEWCAELGFQKMGVSDINLGEAEQRLQQWLTAKFHGSMEYMDRHGSKRSHPDELVPGTVRVISVRMDYFPEPQDDARQLLDHGSKAYISRYALGRDYHKVLRARLRALASRIEERIGEYGYRVFVDSAPVLEKALAEKAGIGWIGKHTNVIDKTTGSWFFLGELYTDVPLPIDAAEVSHCGSCTACIDICPTKAIVGPYVLDARRCISYLTIENKGSIPVEFRKDIGNRIYGCDDCQLFCPWNKYAKPTAEKDFAPRHGLDSVQLTDLFSWDRETWLQKTEGSAIRRIGHERWLRNIAIALGNATTTPEVVAALKLRQHSHSELVTEHVEWALQQHESC